VWNELMRGRGVWLACVLALVGLQTARQTWSARVESQTFDEGLHLASGYMFLVTGEYRMDIEHPPLGRVLNALPLLFMGLDPHLDGDGWKRGDAIEQGRALLYQQKSYRPEQILFRARLVTIALTALLGLAMAFWMRWRFGAGASLLAVFLLTLDPNLSAHGHYVTTDFIAALGCFVAVLAFDFFLARRSWGSVVVAGLGLGFALCSKTSMLFLPAVFGLVWLVSKPEWRRVVGQGLLMAAVAAACVLAAYGPETGRAREGPKIDAYVQGESGIDQVLRFAGQKLGAPGHKFLVAVAQVSQHQRAGHPAYMLGECYQFGRWQYFPFVFAVKTPLGVLVLCLLALGVMWRVLRREWVVLAAPLVVYWALVVSSGINIGVRHLLPVYPLTYALIGAMVGMSGRAVYGKALAGLLVVSCGLVAAESARIAPDDLAFFNVAAGGPANGPKLLVDSNLDWGQDLGKARRWFDARGTRSVCLCYFGSADQKYYGFPEWAVLTTEMVGKGERLPCRYVAISATLLMGVYHERAWYEWLRRREPVARVGWSIYVYDVGDVADAREP
jgi:hypothetical protein